MVPTCTGSTQCNARPTWSAWPATTHWPIYPATNHVVTSTNIASSSLHTSAASVAQVRKSPEVSHSDGEAQSGHGEVQTPAPRSTLLRLSVRHRRIRSPGKIAAISTSGQLENCGVRWVISGEAARALEKHCCCWRRCRREQAADEAEEVSAAGMQHQRNRITWQPRASVTNTARCSDASVSEFKLLPIWSATAGIIGFQ